MLKFEGVEVGVEVRYVITGIEVKAGSTTEILLGAIRLGKFTQKHEFTVYQQGSGKKVGKISAPPSHLRQFLKHWEMLPVPAGTYVLREEREKDVTVVVKAGETVIVEE